MRVLSLDKTSIRTFDEKTTFKRNEREIYVEGFGSTKYVLAVYEDVQTAEYAMKCLFNAIKSNQECFDFDLSTTKKEGFDLINSLKEIKEGK